MTQIAISQIYGRYSVNVVPNLSKTASINYWLSSVVLPLLNVARSHARPALFYGGFLLAAIPRGQRLRDALLRRGGSCINSRAFAGDRVGFKLTWPYPCKPEPRDLQGQLSPRLASLAYGSSSYAFG